MDGQFGDSTYGSYLSGQESIGSGSSSSLTMSLSGSELLEDQPSTSGCSSDMAHSMAAAAKERKKAQVKEYLRQLKEMVPPSGKRKRGRTGTINALQHVIQSFKKIQEDKKETEIEKNIDVSESGIGSSVYDTDDQIKVTNTCSAQDQLVIIVSPGDLSVVDVSANIKDILGYPLDSWKGRDLLNFVNKKDTSAVVSKLTNDFGDFDDLAENKESDDFSVSKFDTRSEQISNKKTLYFRMRHFKGLDSGFSLTKADSYTAFQVTVDVKFKEQVESRLYSPPLSLLQDKDEIISFDKKKKIKFLQLNCVPLLSAYDDPSISSNRTFHTRHTLLSSYSYIHPNAIQLTGFLPHEMVGTSIFDYYHPEDMEQLHNIYKQVLSSKGTPFKSPPVKFRIKNGDYIVVETEWTSFVNPWSHHLEFIIGQHSVIKGPEKTNIFDDTGKPDSSDLPDDGQDLTDKEITDITEKQRPYEISVSPDDSEQSSPGLMCENECSMAYEQLNYTNNIKKFLLSQPKSLSSESDKKESWPSSTEEEEDVSVSDFDVDISVPKPPSFGSSTKVCIRFLYIINVLSTHAFI
ncbi:hypothetical protein KUTeg_001693 [Tegillarca granosa]|uniref:PAS domain-containing protein n=1 Tax=Tegillarca granosa TaxID=220873 RepID=A0ABQ9FS71_TEGGR|nr:hypothetical protein KUTeg_001693 [Tegillarca granosa]